MSHAAVTRSNKTRQDKSRPEQNDLCGRRRCGDFIRRERIWQVCSSVHTHTEGFCLPFGPGLAQHAKFGHTAPVTSTSSSHYLAALIVWVGRKPDNTLLSPAAADTSCSPFWEGAASAQNMGGLSPLPR